jgi:hypothetical protein
VLKLDGFVLLFGYNIKSTVWQLAVDHFVELQGRSFDCLVSLIILIELIEG